MKKNYPKESKLKKSNFENFEHKIEIKVLTNVYTMYRLYIDWR